MEASDEQKQLTVQLETHKATMKHILKVDELMHAVGTLLMMMGLDHDSSKLSSEEFPFFVEHTKTLNGLTYGSPEYKEALVKLKPALDHHYANNPHHPEHYENGINDMNLFDIVEMFVDWFAATKRHADGDIRKSIDINEERFGINPQLAQILRNTVEFMEDLDSSE